jgi:hypothetical protein
MNTMVNIQLSDSKGPIRHAPPAKQFPSRFLSTNNANRANPAPAQVKSDKCCEYNDDCCGYLLIYLVILAIYVCVIIGPIITINKQQNIKNECAYQSSIYTTQCDPGVNQTFKFVYSHESTLDDGSVVESTAFTITILATNTTIIETSDTIGFYNPSFSGKYLEDDMSYISGYVYSNNILVLYETETDDIYDVQRWLNTTYNNYSCCIINGIGYNECPCSYSKSKVSWMYAIIAVASFITLIIIICICVGHCS